MVGYYKVPLYESTLTDIIEYLYVCVLSREFAYILPSNQIVYEGSYGETTTYFGGLYNDYTPSYSLRFSSIGTNNRGAYTSVNMDSADTYTRIKGNIQAQWYEFFTVGPVINEETNDKFNFLRLYKGEEVKYYLKNGNYVHFYENGDKLYWDLCDRTNRKLYSNSASYGSFDVTTTPRLNRKICSKLYIRDYINSLSSRDQYGTFGYALYLYIFDDNYDITWDKLALFTKEIMYYGENYSNINPKYQAIRDKTVTQGSSGNFLGYMSNWFNFGNGDVNLDDFEDIGGTFTEEAPNEDDTYPGGGDDKNTYPPDGESGKGTFDNTNDAIDFPDMPLLDATSTGFISMWNPTMLEILDLYTFLWDSDVSTTLKKLFLEPMEAIISLAFFPVDPVITGKRNVTIGHVDSGVQMNHVQKQFVDFDFGTIKLDEYYGAAWDYSPYTKVSIYLPYIGSQEMDIDDVMNATLHLKYRVDLLSGMCVAMLKSTRSRDGLDAVIYTWQGNCAMQVPITAGSAREFINTFIQIGALTGLALVQPAAGALAMKGTGDLAMSADIMATKSNMINPAMGTFAALNVIGQKVHVQRGGRVDANAGVMSPQSAYIIINRPVSGIPKGWNEYAGYPSLKIKALSTQKGYTQVAYIKLNNLEATAEEISELDGILRGGVIL